MFLERIIRPPLFGVPQVRLPKALLRNPAPHAPRHWPGQILHRTQYLYRLSLVFGCGIDLKYRKNDAHTFVHLRQQRAKHAALSLLVRKGPFSGLFSDVLGRETPAVLTLKRRRINPKSASRPCTSASPAAPKSDAGGSSASASASAS